MGGLGSAHCYPDVEPPLRLGIYTWQVVFVR